MGETLTQVDWFPVHFRTLSKRRHYRWPDKHWVPVKCMVEEHWIIL